MHVGHNHDRVVKTHVSCERGRSGCLSTNVLEPKGNERTATPIVTIVICGLYDMLQVSVDPHG